MNRRIYIAIVDDELPTIYGVRLAYPSTTESILNKRKQTFLHAIWTTILLTGCTLLGTNESDEAPASGRPKPSCTVTPKPAHVGDRITIHGVRLGRLVKVSVRLQTPDESLSFASTTDRKGRLNATSPQAIRSAGVVQVQVIGQVTNDELTACSGEIVAPPTCGDNTCSTSEDCGTCEADCGACPDTTAYAPRCTSSDYDGEIVNENGRKYFGKYKLDVSEPGVCLTSVGTPNVAAVIDGGIVSPIEIPDDDPASWTDSESHNYWEDYYHANTLRVGGDGSSLVFSPTVEFVHIRNAADGISFVQYDFQMPDNPGDDQRRFVVRDTYIQRAGDDAIENDWLASGLVKRVLVDGAFMGFGMRARSADEDSMVGASNNTLVVEDSVIRLTPQYATYLGRGRIDEPGNPRPAHVGFFKWDGDPALDLGLELRNSVFVAYHQPASGSISMNPNGRVDATKSYGNVLVWLGKSAYPHALPPWVTCTRDIGVFRQARARWFLEHPQFVDPYGDGSAIDPSEQFWSEHRHELSYEAIAGKSCSEPL